MDKKQLVTRFWEDVAAQNDLVKPKRTAISWTD